MWELLTGEKPYAGLNMFVIAYGVGHGTLSLPIPEGCPDFLRDLLKGTLMCVCVCVCVHAGMRACVYIHVNCEGV